MSGKYLLSVVDMDAFRDFVLAVENSKGDFQLMISSYGGDTDAMFAFHDYIRCSKRKFVGMAYGSCQSAAVLILAACDRRFCSPNTIFMVHEDVYELEGKHGVTKNLVKQHEREEQLWATLMEQNTDLDSTNWRELSEQETFFNASAASSYGVIDEVMTYEFI